MDEIDTANVKKGFYVTSGACMAFSMYSLLTATGELIAKKLIKK